MAGHGRETAEWDELVVAAQRFLEEQARLERLTSYTELNSVLHQRTGYRPFDFSQDSERAAMGELLGEVSRRRLSEVGALISSIVVYLNQNDAGPGFFRLAAQLDLLSPKASADDRLGFWSEQVKNTHAHYSPSVGA